MSAPALRQPKLTLVQKPKGLKVPDLQNFSDVQNVIVTLKDCRKLVISSDSYHGILMVGSMYKCVLCAADMELDNNYKEAHKTSQKHKKCMEAYPHLEDFSENLLRKLSDNSMYCSICNVVMSSTSASRHIFTETHIEQLEKAIMKATAYKPL